MASACGPRRIAIPGLLTALMLSCALMSPTASAERFVNRWTQAPLLPEGASTAPARLSSADWDVEPTKDGFLRFKSTATGQYLQQKNGRAVAAVKPNGRSAEWTLEAADDGFVRIKNRRGGTYLNVEQGPLVSTAAPAGWWSAQWQASSAAPPTAIAAADSAAPTWVGRRWRASSTATISSAATITTRRDEIVFVNGARLPVRVVNESAQGVWGFSSRIGVATILEVSKPGADPVLADGTLLCGGTPVKFLSLWLETPGGLYFSIYTGPALPKGVDDANVCAIHFFVAED